MRFATRAIRIGQDPDASTGATIVPIFQTSVFTFDSVESNKGYEYSRYGNPTRTALEECLASLEEAPFARCFASGCAAADAILRWLRPGDHILLATDLYGGTYALVENWLKPMGVAATYGDATDPPVFAGLMAPNTKLVWIETPANPLLKITDIERAATDAHANRALLVVDSTFATPYLQNPLALGADVVMHSTTKYIAGHSDLIGGAVMTTDSGMMDHLHRICRQSGATPGPMDCFLALRGVKTLAVRMRQHSANAAAVAEHLSRHPKVGTVHYPGLATDPGHAVARRQMSGFGGMVAAELAGGKAAALAFLNSLRVFQLTGSLGGVESIMSYPWEMSHKPLEPAERLARGVTEGLVRISVGLEDIEDLLEDLDQSLDSA